MKEARKCDEPGMRDVLDGRLPRPDEPDEPDEPDDGSIDSSGGDIRRNQGSEVVPGDAGDADAEPGGVSVYETPIIPRRMLFRVYALLMLQAMSFLLQLPVLPTIKEQFFYHLGNCTMGDKATGEKGTCSEEAVFYTSISSSIASGVAFFLIPVLGRCSDIYGRKYTLRITFALGYAPAVALFLYVAAGASLYWYFVLYGFSLGLKSLDLWMTLLADLSPPEKRQRVFTLAQALMNSAMIVVPFLGMAVRYFWGTDGVIFTAVACQTIAVALAFTAPETLRQEHRRSRHIVCRYPPVPQLGLCCAILMFFTLSESGLKLLVIFFCQDYFNFSEYQNSLMVFFIGLGFCIVSIALVYAKSYDPKALLVFAVACGLLHALCFVLSFSPEMIYLAEMFAGASFFIPLALQTMVSKASPQQDQGAALGLMSGLSSLMEAVGPFLYARLFAADEFLPFQVSLVVLLPALVLSFKLKTHEPAEGRAGEEADRQLL